MAAPRALRIPSGKRSQDKAYLVLLGLTGSGKTATLNFLFDGKEIVTPDGYCSQTSQIIETLVKVPIKNAGECELRVIDTPGFGDTRQQPLERDAQFMATFDNFLKTHADLKSCYPTTILLVVKYNDDRIDGETSRFIQMLKAIDNLLSHYRLIDRDPALCNLVVILTHTMSEDNVDLRADPSAKIQLIEGMIKTFTNIPTPIQVVMSENRPELYDLPRKNGYVELPNKEFYPLNLFTKIQEITTKCDDAVGETIVREAFKNPTVLEKQVVQEVALYPPENLFVKKYFKDLQNAKFNIEATDLSIKLRTLWESLDETFTKPYFNTLQITQSTFQKHGIFSVDDIPKGKEEILKLLAELPINPPLLKVIHNLGISPPELPGKNLGVGNFYNMFGDKITESSPIDMTDFACTEVGYMAPKCIKVKAVEEHSTLVSVYNGKIQYYKERSRVLNVEGQAPAEHFVGQPKPGHNIIVKAEDVQKLTAIKEHRLYQVSLGRKPKLSSEYKATLLELPPFVPKFETAGKAWNTFFLATGTHILKTAYAGGSIEVTATRSPTRTPKTSPETVLRLMEEVLTNVGALLSRDLEAIVEDWEFSLRFHGGDPNLEKPTLPNVFTKGGIELYKSWVASLKIHPVLLHSDLKLENMVIHVQDIDAVLAEQVEAAMKQLTGTTGYIDLPEIDPIIRFNVQPPPKQNWFQKFRNMFAR